MGERARDRDRRFCKTEPCRAARSGVENGTRRSHARRPDERPDPSPLGLGSNAARSYRAGATYPAFRIKLPSSVRDPIPSFR